MDDQALADFLAVAVGPPLPPPRPAAAVPGWGEGVVFPGIGHRPGFPAGGPAQLENFTVWTVWA